ncbi:MAG: radical SAM protein [Clostridia bacterium]|nr:radical SAM protein [Clostridia bacterium]
MYKAFFEFAFQWHITSRCKNKCRHCYMYTDCYKVEDTSIQSFINMYKTIENFEDTYEVKVPSFILTGGAPSLNPDFEQIVSFLQNKGKSIRLMEIPENIDTSLLKIMSEYDISELQLSIDGLPDEHDYLRGKGSFHRTIEAAKTLNSLGIDVRIMFTATSKNMLHIFDVIGLLDDLLGKFFFSFDFVVNEGNAKEQEILQPNNVSREKFLRQYHDFAKTYNASHKNSKISSKPSFTHVMDYDLLGREIKLSRPYSFVSGCLIGWNSMAVLPNGDVMMCRRVPIVIGNLLHNSFEDIYLRNDYLRKFRRFATYLHTCKSCSYAPFCRGCPAVTYSTNDKIFHANDECLSVKKMIENVDCVAPPISCSDSEEFEYIMNSMPNFIGNNPLYFLKNRSVIKTIMLLKDNPQSQMEFINDYLLWQQKYNMCLTHDEMCFIKMYSGGILSWK